MIALGLLVQTIGIVLIGLGLVLHLRDHRKDPR